MQPENRSNPAGSDVIELGVLLAILSARRWLIVLITLVIFGLVSVFVARLPSMYRADTTLMVKGGLSANPLQSLLPGMGRRDGRVPSMSGRATGRPITARSVCARALRIVLL